MTVRLNESVATEDKLRLTAAKFRERREMLLPAYRAAKKAGLLGDGMDPADALAYLAIGIAKYPHCSVKSSARRARFCQDLVRGLHDSANWPIDLMMNFLSQKAGTGKEIQLMLLAVEVVKSYERGQGSSRVWLIT